MIAGLAKAPSTSTGRMVRVTSRMAAPVSATTSERILPQISAAMTPSSTASTMICGVVMVRISVRAGAGTVCPYGQENRGTQAVPWLC